MGYDIIYRKQFIKLNRTKNGEALFIPVAEMGSSNCYDCLPSGKSGRRSRDWGKTGTLLMEKGQVTATEAEMIARLRAINQENVDQVEAAQADPENYYFGKTYHADQFGWYEALYMGGKPVTLKAMESFVRSGCKNAMTIEQITAAGGNVETRVSYWINHDHPHLKGQCWYSQTEEKFWADVAEAKDYVSGTKYFPTVTIGSIDYILEKKKAKAVPRKKADPSTFKEQWVVKLDGYHYLTQLTSRRIKYSAHSKKIFPSKSAAEKTVAKVGDMYPQFAPKAVKL